jgi:hypothetical protein
MVALGTLLSLAALVATGSPASASATSVPLPPTAVVDSQSGTGPDLLVAWTPSLSGDPATGALVQLYELQSGSYVEQSQITCGAGCTSAIFRGLSFGSTYEGLVWPLNAVGTGGSAGSGPATLTDSCSVGACVTLNATSPIGVANHAAAGVLHSVYPLGNVQADMEALKVPMFRSAPVPNGDGTFNWQSWNVAVAAGAQTTLVLSDEYSAAYAGSPPTPWSNWTAYNAEITTLVTQLSDAGEPINYWEVYNEPGGDDNYYSAAGYASETPALLLQQFLDTYQDIISVVPNAQIMGPSLPYWEDYPGQFGTEDHTFDMATFLAFASANDLKLAAVSWHEELDNLGPTPEENSLLPAIIEDHVATARRLIAEYPNLGDPLIVINEYGMPEVRTIPGWDVAYLSALTDAGVDSAGLSCGNGVCANPELDGLLGPDGVTTLPIYFERLVYASMSGNMIATTSSNDWVTSLGSFDAGTGTLTALVGRGEGCTQNPVCVTSWPYDVPQPPISVRVTVTVPWSSGTAEVALSDIEGQTLVGVGAPVPVDSAEPITPAGTGVGTFTISIPSFADGDAYGMVVTHSTAVTTTPAPVVGTTTPAPVAVTNVPCAAPVGGPQGYLLSASDGGVFTFGNVPFCGSTGAIALNRPIVGAALTPDGGGYWEVASDGGIFSFGDAPFYGSTGAIHLNQPIVGMASTPDGKGYWLVARDGGIFTFGDANFYGSTGAIHLDQPIVGMTATADGGGYYLVARDGGIFAFGDAVFHGSMGGHNLDAPIVAMALDPATGGYWEVASDGGIFSFDAPYLGSLGGQHLNAPIVGMAATANGTGYRFVASDGGIFGFGNAPYDGSMGGTPLNRPVVAMAS